LARSRACGKRVCYKRDDRIIYVPLEGLNSKDEAPLAILRHELAHQMMHDMLPVMPWMSATKPEVVRQLEIAQDIMRRYRNTLRELAK
jgi:hypothetical protein